MIWPTCRSILAPRNLREDIQLPTNIGKRIRPRLMVHGLITPTMDRGNTMPRDGRSIMMLLFSFLLLTSSFCFLFFQLLLVPTCSCMCCFVLRDGLICVLTLIPDLTLLFSTDCVKTADKIPLWQLRSRRLCIASWRTSGIYLIIICGLIFQFPVLQQSAVCFYYTGHSKTDYELITCTKHDHFHWRYYMELLGLVFTGKNTQKFEPFLFRRLSIVR